MIEATLTNDSGSMTLPIIEVPLSIGRDDNTVDIVKLDNSMSTHFGNPMRRWALAYDHVKEDVYDQIESFFLDQFSSYQYPTISIPHYNVTDVPVRMYLNTRDVFNNCGDVEGIELQFRESRQLGSS